MGLFLETAHARGWRRVPAACSSALLLVASSYVCLAQNSAAATSSTAAAHTASGIRLFQGGDAAAAKMEFSAAVAADAHAADALAWRGIAENQLQQYRQAARDFEAALIIQPDSVSAEYNLALSMIHLQEPDRAIALLRQVLKARPGAFEPEYNLALLLEQKHAISEAVEYLRAAWKAQPEDPAVVQHLSADLITAGRIDEAAQVLSGSKAAPPALLIAEGDALVKAGHYEKAIPVLEELRQQRPGRDADYRLAQVCIEAHEDSEAVRALHGDLDSDPDGEAWYLTGMADQDMGATQEATAAFQQAIRSNPRHARALYRLAAIESTDAQTLDQAATHLSAAARLEPANADYALSLARVRLEQNHPGEAMTTLSGVHAEGPRAAERDVLRGIAQIILDGPRAAIATLQTAVTEDPSLALAQDMLGFCYFSQGDMGKAAASDVRASDLSPSTLMFARNAAIALEHGDDTHRALNFAKRAAALPDSTALDHEIVGRLLARSGDFHAAIGELTTAISMDPDLEPAYFLLGRTWTQAGDRTQAKVWFDRLQELKRRHQAESGTRTNTSTGVDGASLLRGGAIPSDAPE